MAKLKICKDKSCKNAGTYKIIKGWAKELKIDYKVKKCKCLGLCKETYAIKYKGDISSCKSIKELKRIIE